MFDFSKEFILSLQKWDKYFFNKFYLQTVDVFYRYLKSNYFLQDSEIYDIISDFYLKVWKWIWKYNFDYSFNWWLWTVFKNTAKDYFKSNSKQIVSTVYQNDESVNFDDFVIEDSGMLENIELEYEYEKIDEAIKLLDESSKEILHLKYIENLSNSEISKLTWLKLDNVRQKLSRAIKKLKNKLNNS